MSLICQHKVYGIVLPSGQTSTVSRHKRDAMHPSLTCTLGSIVYVNACGQGLVFLNDSTSFMGLLHQRSEIYSDKPRMVMTGEL